MTKLEEHLEGIINIFHQYSLLTGHCNTLPKGEVKKLMTTELVNTIKNTKDQATVDRIFRDLDEDRGRMIELNEFLNMVASVLVTTHKNIRKD